jgi:hypothetical protein
VGELSIFQEACNKELSQLSQTPCYNQRILVLAQQIYFGIAFALASLRPGVFYSMFQNPLHDIDRESRSLRRSSDASQWSEFILPQLKVLMIG